MAPKAPWTARATTSMAGSGRDSGENGRQHEAGHADEEGATLPEAVADVAARMRVPSWMKIRAPNASSTPKTSQEW